MTEAFLRKPLPSPDRLQQPTHVTKLNFVVHPYPFDVPASNDQFPPGKPLPYGFADTLILAATPAALGEVTVILPLVPDRIQDTIEDQKIWYEEQETIGIQVEHNVGNLTRRLRESTPDNLFVTRNKASMLDIVEKLKDEGYEVDAQTEIRMMGFGLDKSMEEALVRLFMDVAFVDKVFINKNVSLPWREPVVMKDRLPLYTASEQATEYIFTRRGR